MNEAKRVEAWLNHWGKTTDQQSEEHSCAAAVWLSNETNLPHTTKRRQIKVTNQEMSQKSPKSRTIKQTEIGTGSHSN